MLDVAVSALLLAALSPLLLLIAAAIKATSRGPVFYACAWIGKDAQPFTGYKFRTMVADADAMEAALQSSNEMRGPAFKITNDPRITPIGRWLRKYSLDELPQLFSVLTGNMSLVGPRPPREHEFKQFTPFQRQKLCVTPGMTCLWQVEGRHRISDYDDWVRLDLDYINRWSLALDFEILLRTVGVVFRGTGI